MQGTWGRLKKVMGEIHEKVFHLFFCVWICLFLEKNRQKQNIIKKLVQKYKMYNIILAFYNAMW